MKKLFILVLCLLSFANIFAQYKSQLSPRSSVVFPSKPQEMQKEGHVVLFSMLDKENKVTGMATAVDVSQFGVDSASMAANYNNTMFVDLILATVVGQYDGMEVVSKKKIAVGKLMGYDVVFKNSAPSKDIPYVNVFAHVLFAGSNIFAMTVLDEAGSDGSLFKDKFFNSLKVN
jgi:hypothetical protein